MDPTSPDRTCFQYLPWGPFSFNSFHHFLEDWRADPTACNFAIFDLEADPSTPRFAGFINYYQASRKTLTAEIGHVIVLKVSNMSIGQNGVGVDRYMVLVDMISLSD